MLRTSPRTTELLHQRGNLERLGAVSRVAHQRCCFGGETTTPSLARRGLRDRLSRCFRSRHAAPARQVVQGAGSLLAKSKRERWRRRSHSTNVAQNALPMGSPDHKTEASPRLSVCLLPVLDTADLGKLPS
jgi:hypothetical protein